MNPDIDKKTAIISYLTIIGTLSAMLMNVDKKNAFAAFHIRQSLGISVLFFAMGYIVGNFNSWTATVVFWTFIFVMWLYGFIGAIKGKMFIIPIIGPLFQKTFKNIES